MLDNSDMTGGWVYLLTNESMPGIVKIGMTTRNVEQRVRELSASTSAPMPFQVAHRWPVADPAAVEAALHRKLRSRRVNQRREFFRVEPAAVVQMMPLIVDEHGGLRRDPRKMRAIVFVGAILAATALVVVLALIRPDLVFGALGLILLFSGWQAFNPPRRSKRSLTRGLITVFRPRR